MRGFLKLWKKYSFVLLIEFVLLGLLERGKIVILKDLKEIIKD